jgi:hypothetical protein
MPRQYSRAASSKVGAELHKYKRGQAKSGPGGKGGKVKSRSQAIAIALSEARKEGKKVPSRTSRSKTTKSSTRGKTKTAKKSSKTSDASKKTTRSKRS